MQAYTTEDQYRSLADSQTLSIVMPELSRALEALTRKTIRSGITF